MNKIEVCTRELLKHGLDDWVQAAEVVSIIITMHLASEDAEIRRVFLEAVRQVLDRGFMEIGDLTDNGFRAWPENPQDSLERLTKSWDALNRKPGLWEMCWLNNTALGDQLAKQDLESNP